MIVDHCDVEDIVRSRFGHTHSFKVRPREEMMVVATVCCLQCIVSDGYNRIIIEGTRIARRIEAENRFDERAGWPKLSSFQKVRGLYLSRPVIHW
jgi:hypothetical protein